jgi:phosphopantothenoylcysteine decarboxylase / phosphopantothenate---cysteine ligase
MSQWTFPAPTPSNLGDHDVPPEGAHLAGRRVALLVTGGIAAMKIPFVARALRRQGADVVAFTSKEALRYVTAEALGWSTVNPVIDRLTSAAEHLSDSAPFDAYLLAPATYNSINKIAAGVADGVVTSAAASAIGRLERGETAVLVAPTMHGSLHNRILVESLQRLHALGVRVVPPRDAYGKHNLPDERALVAEVARAVSRSKLKGRRVLVTGGTTPVPIDGVRRIVNRFRGRLGIAIAAELHLRGAEILLIHGDGAFPVPSHIPHRVARTYDEYRSQVAEELARGYEAGVFSAGVADYRPAEAAAGKIPSGQERLTLTLVPTAKIIDEARKAHPDLYMVTFKYQEGLEHEALIAIAKARLDRFPCVVANRGEEQQGARQRAWMVTRDADPAPIDGKRSIAAAVADHLEKALGGAA